MSLFVGGASGEFASSAANAAWVSGSNRSPSNGLLVTPVVSVRCEPDVPLSASASAAS